MRYFYNFWSTLFNTNCWMMWFITHSPSVWGLYLTWRNTWRHSNCWAQCALTPDFIPPELWCLNSPDLNSADYSFWGIMQEKVYQTHIANIDELKHRLVQVWTETYRCSYRTAATLKSQCVWLVCESSVGIFWPTFALNLHVALCARLSVE